MSPSMEEALAPLLAESARRETAALARLIAAQWAELSRGGWNGEPADASCRLCLLDCALRLGEAPAWQATFAEIAARQRPDGSFAARPTQAAGDRSATAPFGELLLRGAVALASAELAAAARRALEFVARLDGAPATDDDAAVLRFLGVARALGSREELGSALAGRAEAVRRSALAALLGAQRADGSFAGAASSDHPLGATARALVALAGEVEQGEAAAAEASARGLLFVATQQAATGAFGSGVAPSLSCLRAAMLVAAILKRRFPDELARLGERRDLRFVERGFAWLLWARSERGWGDAPGDAATFERSCEGLALLAEVAAYRSEQSSALARLWGVAA